MTNKKIFKFRNSNKNRVLSRIQSFEVYVGALFSTGKSDDENKKPFARNPRIGETKEFIHIPASCTGLFIRVERNSGGIAPNAAAFERPRQYRRRSIQRGEDISRARECWRRVWHTLCVIIL